MQRATNRGLNRRRVLWYQRCGKGPHQTYFRGRGRSCEAINWCYLCVSVVDSAAAGSIFCACGSASSFDSTAPRSPAAHFISHCSFSRHSQGYSTNYRQVAPLRLSYHASLLLPSERSLLLVLVCPAAGSPAAAAAKKIKNKNCPVLVESAGRLGRLLSACKEEVEVNKLFTFMSRFFIRKSFPLSFLSSHRST